MPEVEHVTFSGARALRQAQKVTYITERCVMALQPAGLTVTEIAPGIDLERDVLGQTRVPLRVSPDLRTMDAKLFHESAAGLTLHEQG